LSIASNPIVHAYASPPSLFKKTRFGVRPTTLAAAEWKPADGAWKETDYEGELKKLEKEAEDRMEAKIADMMTKIDKTGGK
jgi:hypothetical protein